MAIVLKVCLKCGAFSEQEITKCPECGQSEFRSFTAADLRRIKQDGKKITAFFIKWPDSEDWQQVASKNDLETAS